MLSVTLCLLNPVSAAEGTNTTENTEIEEENSARLVLKRSRLLKYFNSKIKTTNDQLSFEYHT